MQSTGLGYIMGLIRPGSGQEPRQESQQEQVDVEETAGLGPRGTKVGTNDKGHQLLAGPMPIRRRPQTRQLVESRQK